MSLTCGLFIVGTTEVETYHIPRTATVTMGVDPHIIRTVIITMVMATMENEGTATIKTNDMDTTKTEGTATTTKTGDTTRTEGTANKIVDMMRTRAAVTGAKIITTEMTTVDILTNKIETVTDKL